MTQLKIPGPSQGSSSFAAVEARTVRRHRDSTSEAQFVITVVGNWIVNADTKAGLLATANAVLGGVVASQRSSLRSAFNPKSPTPWWELPIAGLVALSFLISMVALVAVLRPRIRTGPYSRYSWPAVANLSAEDVLSRARRNPEAEAWRTARDLSLIARRKFLWLRVAIFSWAVTGVLSLSWVVLHP
ncbi:Pycsar system effector family protein [Lentzea sp. NPDC058436]|uniref:Pycsar system effector family protein n=1 Tax=Lentzea sp. NPDC058436 TaxID=3346499 RepID=UPI00366339D0